MLARKSGNRSLCVGVCLTYWLSFFPYIFKKDAVKILVGNANINTPMIKVIEATSLPPEVIG